MCVLISNDFGKEQYYTQDRDPALYPEILFS